MPKRLKMAWKKRNCAHFKTGSTICPDFWHVAYDIHWRTLCLPKRMYVRNWRCNDINRLWGSTAVLVWALRQQSKLGYGLYKRFWPGSVRAFAKHRLVSNVAALCVFFTKSTVICLGTEYDDNSNTVIFILPQNWNEHLPLQECLLRNCIDTFFFVNWVCVDLMYTRLMTQVGDLLPHVVYKVTGGWAFILFSLHDDLYRRTTVHTLVSV